MRSEPFRMNHGIEKINNYKSNYNEQQVGSHGTYSRISLFFGFQRALYGSGGDRTMLSEKKTRPASNRNEPTKASSIRIIKISCIFVSSSA
jgi:hypothetical protein